MNIKLLFNSIIISGVFLLCSCNYIEENERIAYKTSIQIKEAINEKDANKLRQLFAPAIQINEGGFTAKNVIDGFPSGISLVFETDEDFEGFCPSETETMVYGDYTKDVEWSFDIIDNATGQGYTFFVAQRVENDTDDEQIGVHYIDISTCQELEKYWEGDSYETSYVLGSYIYME